MTPLSPNLRRALARVTDTWETAEALHLSERSLWALERRALVEAKPEWLSAERLTRPAWEGLDAHFLWRRLRPADPRPDPGSTIEPAQR